jgi:hypothetical protein
MYGFFCKFSASARNACLWGHEQDLKGMNTK